jgi:hypothetical protein
VPNARLGFALREQQRLSGRGPTTTRPPLAKCRRIKALASKKPRAAQQCVRRLRCRVECGFQLSVICFMLRRSLQSDQCKTENDDCGSEQRQFRQTYGDRFHSLSAEELLMPTPCAAGRNRRPITTKTISMLDQPLLLLALIHSPSSTQYYW